MSLGDSARLEDFEVDRLRDDHLDRKKW